MQKFILLIWIFITSGLYAQDEGYKKWLEAQNKNFKNYQDEMDKKFGDYLKQQWKQFESFAGKKADEKPKPKTLPKADPAAAPPAVKQPAEKPVSPPKPEPNPIPETEPAPMPKPVPPPPPKPQPIAPPAAVSPYSVLDIPFFGVSAKISAPKEVKAKLIPPVNNDKIASFWDEVSQKDFSKVLSEAAEKRAEMNLNDWGYLLLLKKSADAIYRKGSAESTLLLWYLLNKSGYMVKVAYNKEGGVFLLAASEDMIYGMSYIFRHDKVVDYIIDPDNLRNESVGSVYSYDKDFPGSKKMLSMSFSGSLAIGNDIKAKKLNFSYKGKSFELNIRYNKNSVDFFLDYPYVKLENYFSFPPSPEASSSLISGLKPVIAGKSKPEQVNMIMRFVQTAFEYKVDDDNFGREKPLFRDEILHYQYSDCEDRAILYTYLVKELTGLKVVAIDWPGHVAAAVKFDESVPGDYITYKGAKYTVTDPTYINSYAGMCMPDFKAVQPEAIIEIN
ncbi:MAG: hypothetical protein K9I71_03605 [Ignavibacteriales bacterium]|nr:hypothetical protein [Ignavibacteriales bacterium]MCF8435824.1 hypothetical protein [Ignavibacteriales bacterium]